MNGNIEVCQLILDDLDDVTTINENEKSPFLMATTNGHFEICRMLIEHMKDKNPADKYGQTPLHVAAKEGHLNVFGIILEACTGKLFFIKKGTKILCIKFNFYFKDIKNF